MTTQLQQLFRPGRRGRVTRPLPWMDRVAGRGLASSAALAGLVALAAPAHADCDNHTPGDGDMVTCDTSDPNPDPNPIVGVGSNVTVNVEDEAGIETGGPNSINGSNADGWLVNNSGSVVSEGSTGIIGNSAIGWTIINSAGSVVSGGNDGINGSSGSGWTIENFGSINGGDEAITGSGGSNLAIVNFGSISGGNDSGNEGGILMPGGSIINHPGAEISGFQGVRIDTGTFPVNVTIDNAGTIVGSGGNAILAADDTESVELLLRGTSVLDGDVELQGGSNTLSLEGDNSEDGNFAGFSQVNVQAGADWTLSGSLTPLTSGTLEAEVAGTLRLNGLLEGAVQVQADGRLGGTGTVGETTNDGTVAAGESIGTLSVDGAYTHAGGATLEVEIEPGGTADLLAVNGAADLQGGTVSVLLAAGDYEPGTEFPILTANGGVNGEFATLEVDNPDADVELVHEDDTVLLVVSQQQEEGADLALTKTATVNEGATVVFTLEATNSGPEDATEVVVVDTLPACVELTNDDCGGTESDGDWTWTIDQLATGETVSCELTTDASGCAGEGEQTNTAGVSSAAQDDPNPDNDTAEAVFDLEVVPALPRLAFVFLLALLSLAALRTLRRSNA